MSNSQEIRTGRHCVFNMHVHLVFVAKYRRDVFTKAMLETMREVFERVCLDFEGKRPLNPTFSNSLIPR
ncbi:hypothetical protein HMPREF0016_02480 [Acinetobacter johnsonii SH046]|jgi:putative transposase|uniref:Transposase IS200-like domain-containing protein n=2 Tax=Acinetobacter johnsonii TaxID=40214 RepID=D0SEV3_ACIJO|nr:hypothetical protein HMPREF0016_02480 [Acinetobacter johnsonii SH046]GEK45332.1 hypothetical protein AJO04nite_25900 [Acinetobacter johnsonii]SNU14892.1 Transposase [Acinetobacter johnsonii]